jgi:hypothetical protein
MKKIFLVLVGVFFWAFLPKLSLAATLYLSPASSSVVDGATFSVTVRVNTQSADVNTAEANISYSTDTLDLVSVKQGANFYLSSPGSPSRGQGTAYFGGGIPNPGYNGTSGVLGTLSFRAKATGSASIVISSGKVLLNDGNGTDALSGMASTKISITETPASTSTSLTVTSTTHPDPTKWFAKSDVSLSWNRPANIYGYSFELDQTSDTIPDNTLDTTITTNKTYIGNKDGVWYFHIKARAQSASAEFTDTVHFKIQIDATAPKAYELALSNSNKTVSFQTTDDASGIGRYELSVDDKMIESDAKSPYNFSDLSAGPHVVKVMAYDLAGNSTAAQASFIVSSGSTGTASIFPKSVSIPFYAFAILILLILILILLNIWLLVAFLRRGKRNYGFGPIAKLQTDIDEMLENLRHDIDHKLLGLTAKSSEDLFVKQAKAARAIEIDINKTKQKIDNKIDKSSRKR